MGGCVESASDSSVEAWTEVPEASVSFVAGVLDGGVVAEGAEGPASPSFALFSSVANELEASGV